MSTPRKVGAAVGTAAATGAGVLAATTLLNARSGLGPTSTFAALTVLLGLNWAFPLLVLRRDETEAYQLDEGFFVVMALVLPPLGTVAAFALAALGSQLARRRPLVRVVFNTSQAITATGAGLAVAHLAGLHSGVIGGRGLVAVVAGAATFTAVNNAVVSGIIGLIEGRPPTEVFVDGLGTRLLVGVASISLGLLTGVGAARASWALALAVVPMMVLQVVLAGYVRAERDRERMDGLFQAAVQTHRSIEVGDVERALEASAAALLRCRSARLGPTPPAAGELGAALAPEGTPRWLVVAEPRGEEPLGPRDGALLDAVAAVGAAALQNATLVDRIKHDAFHDALTGLPNRVLVQDRLAQALERAGRSSSGVGVLVVDLDRFKKVNDSLGHQAGNELLCQVAARLVNSVRAGDTVARLGGDEFVVVLTDLPEPAARSAATVAAQILEAMRRPFELADREAFVTASIGVALAQGAGVDPADLVQHADLAMGRAKEQGRNTVRSYAAAMDHAGLDRLALEAKLHRALEQGGLSVVYQPQVELASGRVVGVEALARWHDSDLGPVSPELFIALAEDTGLIVDLDSWVLRTACAQTRAWSAAGLPDLRVAVNVSGRHFSDTSLVNTVSEVLFDTGLDPSQLELEVTESVAVDTAGLACAVLSELRTLGVQIALDDFGTGYSVLSRLRHFPFDRLKIDRSFVSEITSEQGEAPLVVAIVAMAHGLGLEVVAEGVETAAQCAYLTRLGCGLAQGYLFARPMAAGDLVSFLRRESSPPGILRPSGFRPA